LENPAPERGQFSSLQIAAAAVLADLRWAGAVVVPVDRPMFAPTTLAALAAALAAAQEAAVLKPAHAGCHGHPVLYGRAFLAVIAAAPADATAREVARPWAARTLAVAVADPGVLINVDTPEDYRRIAAHRP
ncbi:MAG: NTP transferase domain-containing protein, partial [Terriglobales bacterium]